ncbi:MAG: DoxX family protein [Varibaculum sp.]|nr:DoxX family protein [Varibaculum sp.]
MNFLQARFLDKASLRDLGLLILRIAPLTLILSGAQMLMDFQGTVGMMAHSNPITAVAPELFAVLIPLGQILLPIFILAGLFTRGSGLLLALMFLGTMFFVEMGGDLGNFVHTNDRGTLDFGFQGGWFYFMTGLALIFTGAGRYALDYVFGKSGDPVRE